MLRCGQKVGLPFLQRRLYQVLAIETSCDDTSVAWLDHDPQSQKTHIVQNLKTTLDSVADGGIIPTAAHEHHQVSIGPLIRQVIDTTELDSNHQKKPDLICVTRGPGMLGSLSTGLVTAKALSIAWDVPLLGVNHMLGHLLVPRLYDKSIRFPFVSLLVSGGHCILVHSTSVTDHKILCESIDIAAGDSLDKCGREIGLSGIMIGKSLNLYTNDIIDPWEKDEILDTFCKLPNPLTKTKKSRIAFSFSPFITAVKQFLASNPLETLSERQHKLLAARIQDSIFNHIITKVKHTIEQNSEMFQNVNDFVCSGGVSANDVLRGKLQNTLKSNFSNFHYPPLELCTDNAVMIGYAGIELYDKFQHTISNELDILPLRKWSLENIVPISNFQRKDSKKSHVNK
ncbi:similar to Saccharomyces cerevisiae YDL104C QRI7 Highly conserved mitochondrial protein, essential for t6A modification of mitochondrial tRNAs that decode ANN codons [Maudiozyma saulgeensis]|uniref:N(6)-L-threonylcarbamoyladenine synthase n=1 Tax=Maudiozyma saulgeensis TaxID=1789683 RepID=A0A1X7QZC2_9SACH|nr:similar to Saccharomyces cerevisiae YDL104C QRI7 Highly conserved mitochondrial protein, essential for t6A modification of mitochondrial tRNAs that decode ANN codons [Kazachstania saulgeensis]